MDNERNRKTVHSSIHEFEKTHSPEQLSYLFIELFFGQQKHKNEEFTLAISMPDWLLLDRLIDTEAVPEECAQQLLCIKVLFLMHRMKTDAKSGDVALTLLDRLVDPDYRLTCFSRTYFELVVLKADILVVQEKHLEAYEYVKGIYDLYESDPAFNQFEDAKKLKNEFLIKMAIAAHFANIEGDLSYQLFIEALFANQQALYLSYSNCNIFIIFGYECFRQKKYDDALKAFEHVSGFLRENNLIIPPQVKTSDLEQEMIAMRLLSKKMMGMNVSHEEFLGFCNAFAKTEGMSDKNQNLRKYVIELFATEVIFRETASAQPQPVTPMYNTAVRQEQSKRCDGINKSLNKPHEKNGSPRYG